MLSRGWRTSAMCSNAAAGLPAADDCIARCHAEHKAAKADESDQCRPCRVVQVKSAGDHAADCFPHDGPGVRGDQQQQSRRERSPTLSPSDPGNMGGDQHGEDKLKLPGVEVDCHRITLAEVGSSQWPGEGRRRRKPHTTRNPRDGQATGCLRQVEALLGADGHAIAAGDAEGFVDNGNFTHRPSRRLQRRSRA